MIDAVTTQNTELSSLITLYIRNIFGKCNQLNHVSEVYFNKSRQTLSSLLVVI